MKKLTAPKAQKSTFAPADTYFLSSSSLLLSKCPPRLPFPPFRLSSMN